MEELIRRCQREFRSDIFGFGNYARGEVTTWDQLLALDWPRRFPEAQVNVAVEVQIRRVGLQRKTYQEYPIVSWQALSGRAAGDLACCRH